MEIWRRRKEKYVIGYGKRKVDWNNGKKDSTNNKKMRRAKSERLQRNNNYAVDVQDLHGDIS